MILSFMGTFVVGKNCFHCSGSLPVVSLMKMNSSHFQFVLYFFFSLRESGNTCSFSPLSYVFPARWPSGAGPMMTSPLAPFSEEQYLAHEKRTSFSQINSGCAGQSQCCQLPLPQLSKKLASLSPVISIFQTTV